MKVGFIGAGKMAEAILAALVASGVVKAAEITASDVSEARRRRMRRRYGAGVTARNRTVVARAQVVFLAVKPQQLDAVLEEIAPAVTRSHLFISIAAGKTIARLEALLPDARVIRVMPNLPCVVGEGVSAFCAGSRATRADRGTADALLSSCGKVLELPEELFDAVTAVSGSGPAFFAYLLNCVVEAGTAEGLTRADALLLAEQTMLGTARLLMEQNIDPQALIDAVTSAKGTTAAGRAVLEKSSVPGVLRRTIRAAARRSRELSAVRT